MAECPIKFTPLHENINKKIKKSFSGCPDGMIKGHPGGIVLTPRFNDFKDCLFNFQLRPSDVWISTFPKCGTTWIQELVWLLLNDLDFKGARAKSTLAKSSFIEYNSLLSHEYIEEARQIKLQNESASISTGVSLEELGAMPGDKPRLIKSHLPWQLLPPKLIDTCKVVYVARNPRDVIVSYYHHCKMMKAHGFQGDFPEFLEYFLDDCVCYSPYWLHLLTGYAHRCHPNVLFVFYEDMKQNFRQQIVTIASFFDKELSDASIANLEEFLEFENCKKRWEPYELKIKETARWSSDGNFFRKGIVGDHINYFTEEMNQRMMKWMNENLRNTDFVLPTSWRI